MFRNFSEALGAWSGWVIDQAAKEVIVGGGGGSGRLQRRQMERFATVSDASAACIIGSTVIDPTSAQSFANVAIKNADTGLYISPGAASQSITSIQNALKFDLNQTSGKYTLQSLPSAGGKNITSTIVGTNNMNITKNTDNTYNIQRTDVAGNNGYLIPTVENGLQTLFASNKISFSKLACGSIHTIGLGIDGILYSWGVNTNGQLGNGTTINSSSPVVVSGNLKNITYISAGGANSFAIADGKLYAWGDNSQGQLGIGGSVAITTNKILVPTEVLGNLTNVTSVSSGGGRTAILANGKVYMCGRNTDRFIGTGSQDPNVTTPTLAGGNLPNLTVSDVQCNNDGTVIAIADGMLYGWGNSGVYILGDTMRYAILPTHIFKTLTNIKSIALGNSHILVVSNGTLYSWGYNTSGQLGTGSAKSVETIPAPVKGGFSGSAITSMKASSGFNLLLYGGSQLYAWGSNSTGQVGNSSINNVSQPVLIGTTSASMAKNLSTQYFENITDISIGEQFGSIISNGQIYSWGDNTRNQYGDGTTTVSRYPIRMPFCGSPTPVEKSRWIFEQMDDPDKCTVRTLTVDKLVGAYIRCVLDIPLLDNNQRIIIKINDKINFTYNYSQASNIKSTLKSFIIYDINGSLKIIAYNNDNTNMVVEADTNANGVTLSGLTDIKIDIIQLGVVKASASYKNVNYKLPSDTFITSFRPALDTTYCLSLSNIERTFQVCKNPNKNIQLELISAPANIGQHYIPNFDKLFSIKDTATNATYYLQQFSSSPSSSFTTNKPTLTATSQNYVVKLDVDASGAYTFYFIPTNQASLFGATTYSHIVLKTSTASISTTTQLIPEYVFIRFVKGIPNIYTSSKATTLYTIDAKNKFFIDDRCDTVSCSNKQASLTASYLPWNSATLPECDNCTPPTSYDPCSASGPCQAEKDRRTASKLKWSSSDIEQCKACGSMMPNSWDPCNSASCAAAKRQAASSFQPYNPSTFPECADCSEDTGGLPGTYDPCSASGDCETIQQSYRAAKKKFTGSDFPECQSCGSLKANSYDPCNSASCTAAKQQAASSFQPYNPSTFPECADCSEDTGGLPGTYDPCSASGDCETIQQSYRAAKKKFTGSDFRECQSCGSLKANSYDPCNSASCAAAKRQAASSFQPYNPSTFPECADCSEDTGGLPGTYDPCSASGPCQAEKDRRTASNIKWSSSDIDQCKACGSMMPNSWDPCKSEQCAAKKKSLTDIFMPWTQATITPECDHCPAGTGSLPDSYTPCGPNGQCDAAQKSRTASGISWIGSQIPECRNCGSDQTNAKWSPPPPPPPPPAPTPAPAPAPATRSTGRMVYPVVYTDGRRINPSEATQICKTVGGPTESSVATNAQINTGITATRKWCHDTIDSKVVSGGNYSKTANQNTRCGVAYKPVAKDSAGKPIYKDVMCYGNRLPIGTVVPSPAGNLRVSAMEGKDTFVGSRESFVGSQYTPAMTQGRHAMTSGGVSAGRIPLMPADMQGSTPTIDQGRGTSTFGYSAFTPRR